MLYKCVTCNGTGEVHSHNPRCWDCHGSGKTNKATAEKAIREQVMPTIIRIMWLSRRQFDEAEQQAEILRLLDIYSEGYDIKVTNV